MYLAVVVGGEALGAEEGKEGKGGEEGESAFGREIPIFAAACL